VRYLDDELCDLYREANLKFPQVEVGIVPVCAELMLRKGPAYLGDSLTLDFSPAQVESIRRGMDRAHGARKIPALSPEALYDRQRPTMDLAEAQVNVRVIDDARIRTVWRNIVVYMIDAIVDCARVARPSIEFVKDESPTGYERLAQALPACFVADPVLLDQIATMFTTTVRALNSPAAQRSARSFRQTLHFADVQEGRRSLSSAREELHRELATLLLESLCVEHPEFAPLIRDRNWRIFRPLMSINSSTNPPTSD
jgi:hypothetical protein